MVNASLIPMPVLLIIVIVLLVAVVFLIVRTASLGKRLQKLTQAFVNERHKVSQIVRYLDGEAGALDGVGGEQPPQLRQPVSNGRLSASTVGGAPRQFQSAEHPDRIGAQGAQAAQGLRPERQDSQGAMLRDAQRQPAAFQGQDRAVADQVNRVNPVGPARMGGTPTRAAVNAVRPIGSAVGDTGGRQLQRNSYHEEREKRNKKGFGRRNKPVIPFGADRTNEQRAARAAAAMIDDAPALSMDLSEPAAILRQQEMAGRRSAAGVPVQGSVTGDAGRSRAGAGSSAYPEREPLRRNMAGQPQDRRRCDDAQRAARFSEAQPQGTPGFDNGARPANGAKASMDARPSNVQERRRFVGESGGMGDRAGVRMDASAQQRSDMQGRGMESMAQRRPMPDAGQRMVDQEPRQPQGARLMQENSRFSGQDRGARRQEEQPARRVEEDPRIAQEKAAVSAAWIAEEERRMAERQARAAAQAKRAEKREQAQLRRQAEAIVQEHHRQTQSARTNDTMRFG